jgi:hypothetical protein
MTSDSQIELNKTNNTIVVILVPHVLSDRSTSVIATAIMTQSFALWRDG